MQLKGDVSSERSNRMWTAWSWLSPSLLCHIGLASGMHLIAAAPGLALAQVHLGFTSIGGAVHLELTDGHQPCGVPPCLPWRLGATSHPLSGVMAFVAHSGHAFYSVAHICLALTSHLVVDIDGRFILDAKPFS